MHDSRFSPWAVAPNARSAAAVAILAAVALPAGTGCKDKGKSSAQQAAQNATALVAMVDKDVAEIERGMPEGAKRFAPTLAAAMAKKEPPEPQTIRQGLQKTRREVPDLNVAKSTFFAVADDKGIAVRNDLEIDTMAGQNLVQVFPDLARALAGTYVETTGAFPGAMTPQGPDKDWIAAAPIQQPDGAVSGIYLTGWSYRRYAYHLQEQLKHDLGEALIKANDTGKLPVLYVALFDKSGVFFSPQTPPVNERALEGEKLVDKTASGPVQGALTVTDRDFGYAAARAPKLGPDVGVAILRSDL
jgi:hypothetical protein